MARINGWLGFAAIACCLLSGCNFLPDVRHKAQFHNPFPQIRTVAILPFRNQSEAATLSGERVSLAYSHELQAVPGFEVLPVGAVRNQLLAFEQQQLRRPVATPEDFQAFAQYLGVDAVIQGAITDYDPYYPPRLTFKTNWYTANPNFHPVPVGYGLPWGTSNEKKIPEWVRLEAERELAAEQLVSQTPGAMQSPPTPQNLPSTEKIPAQVQPDAPKQANATDPTQPKSQESAVGTSVASNDPNPKNVQLAGHTESINQASHANGTKTQLIASEVFKEETTAAADNQVLLEAVKQNASSRGESQDWLEAQAIENGMTILEPQVAPNTRWPDPEGFIPPIPSAVPPQPVNFTGPVISHMATYNGTDEDFTSELEEYYYFRDDGRFGGWESYLQRSEDFIRFCCHLHIKQTLVGRGGQLKNRTVVRWPFSRYHER